MALLALIKNDAVLSTFFDTAGRVDVPGLGQVSPPVDGWEVEGFQIKAVQIAGIPEGHIVISGPTYSVVDGIPVQTYVTEPAPVAVPGEITPFQARMALDQLGLYDMIESYVATLPRQDQWAWQYANTIHRDNAIIASGAAALGLTEAQIDEIFVLGMTF